MRPSHRRRRRAPGPGRVLGIVIVTVLVASLGIAASDADPPARFGGSARPGEPPVRAPALISDTLLGLVPVRRAEPRYVRADYRAPSALVDPGAGGALSIPGLGIAAPVDAVGLDGGAMAIPDDPHRVGWLRTTATDADRTGSSVLAGHVSDDHDIPGALGTLDRIRLGAVIVWTAADGRAYRFVVVRVHRYPRTRGVPAAVFSTGGAHLLRLVTCTDRRTTSGGGFHYASNLVVTARPERPGRAHQAPVSLAP